jgi:hypothetical protein
LGCLLITLAVFVPTWLYRHMDIVHFLWSTWQLFWDVLRSLLNVPELVRLINTWVNQRVIAWILNPAGVLLAYALAAVMESMWKGALIIFGTLAVLVASAFAGLVLRNWWNSVKNAVKQV